MGKHTRSRALQAQDFASLESLPAMWELMARQYGNLAALHDPHSQPVVTLSYEQVNAQIRQFAAGLQARGLQPDAKVALIADNSPRWLVADQGIMLAGGVDVVRSSQAERQELLYILEHSDSSALVIEDSKTLEKLRPELDTLPIAFVVLLSDESPDATQQLECSNFTELMAAGKDRSLQPAAQGRDRLATLIYTSGTTGKPKGVMLSHGNLLHQVEVVEAILQPKPGDRALSILPTWHSYERSCEYFLFSRGCSQIYTSLRHFKKDIQAQQPEYIVGVPRLWESIYDGIQKQISEQPASKQRAVKTFLDLSGRYVRAKRIAENLSLNPPNPSPLARLVACLQALLLAPLHALGDRLVYRTIRQGVGGNIESFLSGGGSLARHIDDFFEAIGIPVLVGYGLTETAPITHGRIPSRNLRGSAGRPIPGTEARIVDPESRQPVATGQRGLVLLRGPQVMQGYYKNPDATAKAIDADGWFDSGDLGWVTAEDDLILTGRAKDTIVLTNGENIEPQPIEDACVRSTYVNQIVLVGQDQRALGALIVPDLEALQQWVQSQQPDLTLPTADAVSTGQTSDRGDLDSQPVQELFRQELNREVQNRPGYRIDDRITVFRLLLEPFSPASGTMTQTLKIKRPVVHERYRDIIDGMFAS
ncbi:Long-chain acyl-CoA synthetase (AMP-forming) [Rubidibacter lacunae KORDI 51-2]|uniref:Long-chain acyl-CoA synthetase (AMP-forming) n=1 Tax=Rubidibacter lacunae KORDI 51-2 TaxID=582515 RepID=U5D8T2_9CHRO|nr:AMP-binding protein [Rubidibacter lacunae]ERN41008.1 Long-chain acyl-CoA synthetase (AMP-forming) [Rubidibacter lacunae KORDI 51-2]